MRWLTLLFIALTGCTTTNSTLITLDRKPYNYVDSAFRPGLEIFEYLAASNSIMLDKTNISITFGITRGLKSNAVGLCSRDALGSMVIKIDENAWKAMDEYQREVLLFHELGHCLLGRPHCVSAKNKKMSIMHPSVLPSEFYKKYRKELIHELFNPNPRCKEPNGDIHESHGRSCPSSHRIKK